MTYCFQLLSHANIRYRAALESLGCAELDCLLRAMGLTRDIRVETIGGCAFLAFDGAPLSPEQIALLFRHSAGWLLCEKEGELLRPIEPPPRDYLPADLAELLKYKGKTSAVFTRMLINCALAVSDFFPLEAPTVLDPLCGRGTTCFTALQGGMNAVGLDCDRRDLKEAADYFSRYLQFHRLKHKLVQGSRTLKKTNVPEAVYTVADTREHYQADDTRTLTLYLGDTGLTAELMRKQPAHVLVADLPYGVQHAPQAGSRTETLPQLLGRALPVWRQALLPGGAMALSFNTMTLPRKKLLSLVTDAGFTPLFDESDRRFEHYVEQAVNRDVVLARR